MVTFLINIPGKILQEKVSTANQREFDALFGRCANKILLVFVPYCIRCPNKDAAIL